MGLCKLRAAAEAGAALPLCPSHSLVYRLAKSQPYRRKEIPSAVGAAVFVLPNSILFHSLSADSVYFGALLHRWALQRRRTKTSDPTSNPVT